MTPILNLHDIDVTKFLAVLDTCEGNVYLVTSEGDRLNLKSKLCQLVGLTKLLRAAELQRQASSVIIRMMKANFSDSISLVIQQMPRLADNPSYIDNIVFSR